MSREELLKENTELKEKYAALKQQYSQLLKLTRGFKSERFIPTYP